MRIQPETIDSARLVLEPLRADHAGPMARVLSDPGLHRFTGGSPESAAELLRTYERRLAGSPDPDVSWCNWVIRLRSADELAGYMQATIAGRAVAEVSWVVGTPWQGRGLAAEAARALVAWLGRVSVDVVIAYIHPDHQASCRIAEAAGLAATAEHVDGEVVWRRAGGLPESRPATGGRSPPRAGRPASAPFG